MTKSVTIENKKKDLKKEKAVMKKIPAILFLIILSISLPAQTVKVQYLCGEPTVFFYKIRPFISKMSPYPI